MKVLFIKDYRDKLILLSLGIILWVLMLGLSYFILNNALSLKVTINNYLSFKCPVTLDVDNIFVSNQMITPSIFTSATVESEVHHFINYSSLKGKFSINFPYAFFLEEKDFVGSEILYHIDFKDKSHRMHGFIQVWNLPYPLKEFLDNSKNLSNLNLSDFSSKNIIVQGIPGYVWEYTVIGNDGNSNKGIEVFIQKESTMYRISLFTQASLWNKSTSKTFWEMVDSFKIIQ